MAAGRVGRAHGLDGSFVLSHPAVELDLGMVVRVGEGEHRIERLGGTPQRLLVRLEGIDTRDGVTRLAGQPVLVPGTEEALADAEWLVDDLVGCRIEGLGVVARVIGGSSCDVLELEDGTLVPVVSDAVLSVDLPARQIAVNHAFLGLER